MAVDVYINDEHPQWPATIVLNGSAIDYSSGYTFTCTVVNQSTGATLLSKTSGITGGTGGAVTVAFTGAELSGAGITATWAANNQTYDLYLTPRKTSDSSDGPTVQDVLTMKWRP